MRIFIDATGLTEPITGLTNYSSNLMKEILAINNGIKFTVLCSKSANNNQIEFLKKDPNVRVIYSSIPNVGPIRDLKYLFLYPLINKHDLFHCLSSYLPFFKIRTKTIITIHDLKYLKLKNLMSSIKTNYLKISLKRSLYNADNIIAVSNSTASDIGEIIGLNKKTKVIYEANTLKIYPSSKEEDKKINKKFFLCIGENRPHKNYFRVIKAYFQACSESDENFPNLFIAGNKVEELDSFIKDIGIDHKVSLMGKVSSKKIFWLYRNAFALVYASLYEGFGLPLLEAMNSKLPIITSNMHSTKEISDGAAYLVDPYSIDEISGALINFYRNKNLRESLIQKGLDREKFFSWHKSAKQTYDIYQRINHQ